MEKVNQLSLDYDWQVSEWQISPLASHFSDQSQSLFNTSFVVLDLETTGGNFRSDAIIEIAAIKIIHGEIVDRFHSLINPQRFLSEFIINLTGINQSAVDSSPTIDEVLPSFLIFLQGSIPIAHNARFDISFLKHNAKKLGVDWIVKEQVCTLQLARKILQKDEVSSYKLGVLSKFFSTETTPTHQAMDDVLATVEIFYKLLERIGNTVTSYADLVLFLQTPQNTAFIQSKKASLLSHDLPSKPGVYIFYDAQDAVLYIGKSINISQRVKQYFTQQEKRSKIQQMLKLAVRVEAIECAHEIEASIRELHLIAHHLPPYNRIAKRKSIHYYLLVSHNTIAISDNFSAGLKAEEIPYFPALRLNDQENSYIISCLSEHKLTQKTLSHTDYLFGPFISKQIVEDIQYLIHQYSSSHSQVFNIDRSISITRTKLMSLQNYCEGSNIQFIQYFMNKLEEYIQNQEFEKGAILRDRLSNLIRNQAYLRKKLLLESLGKAIIAKKHPDQSWDVLILDSGRFKNALKIAATQNISAQLEYVKKQQFPDLTESTNCLGNAKASMIHGPFLAGEKNERDFSHNTLNTAHIKQLNAGVDISLHETLMTANLICSWITQEDIRILWSEYPLAQARENNEKFEKTFRAF